MATKELVKMRVKELTRYGFSDDTGYVSYSKGLNDSDKALVVPGAEFEAELYIADSGTRYLNKIVAGAAHVSRPKPVAVTVKPSVKATPKVAAASAGTKTEEAPMTRTDWESKDRRISRQGCIQAAVQACAHFATDEVLFAMAEKLANKMLEFVNEVQ